MTQHEINILDRQLKGINLRMIWALILCTAVSISTALSVYYGFKTDIAIQNIQLRVLEARVSLLEVKINK